MVAVQFFLAWLIRDQPWWVAVLLAFAVGGFVIHGLNCVIHECTHNLVFQGSARNKAVGIFATLPTLVPAACGFRHYHLLHHREFGVRGLDADVPPAWEIKLVGHSWWRKLIWLLILPLGLHRIPALGIRDRMPLDGWFAANIVTAIIGWVLVIHFLGYTALTYLLVSAYLSVGPHPGRRAYPAGTYRVLMAARSTPPITAPSTGSASISAITWSITTCRMWRAGACRACAGWRRNSTPNITSTLRAPLGFGVLSSIPASAWIAGSCVMREGGLTPEQDIAQMMAAFAGTPPDDKGVIAKLTAGQDLTRRSYRPRNSLHCHRRNLPPAPMPPVLAKRPRPQNFAICGTDCWM